MSSSWNDPDLADDPGVRLDRADERAQRAPDVARDLDRPPVGAEHLAEKRRRRRLSVRPGDRDDRVREESRTELELVPDRNAASASSRDQRRVGPDSGTLDDQIDPLCQRLLLASHVNFDATLTEPSRVRRLVEGEGDDVGACVHQRVRRGRAGTREADDENAPAGELRGAHVRAGRTGGSRGRRARIPRRRRSRRRPRSAP